MDKKMLIVGGAIVAVAAIAYFGFIQQPPAGNEVAGTIGAAQRHATETTTDADVVLGDQALTDLMQNDMFVKLMEDPELRTIVADPEFAKLAADPRFAEAAGTPQFQNQLQQFASQGGFTPQLKDGAVVAGDQVFATLVESPQFMKLAANPRFMRLAADPRFAKLAADPDFSAAMGSPRFESHMVQFFGGREPIAGSGQGHGIEGTSVETTGGVDPQQQNQ